MTVTVDCFEWGAMIYEADGVTVDHSLLTVHGSAYLVRNISTFHVESWPATLPPAVVMGARITLGMLLLTFGVILLEIPHPLGVLALGLGGWLVASGVKRRRRAPLFAHHLVLMSSGREMRVLTSSSREEVEAVADALAVACRSAGGAERGSP